MIHPDKPVSRLIQEGPFRYTCNPVFLSRAMIYAGIAVLRNALWAIILLPLALNVIQREVMGHEGRYLKRRLRRGVPTLQGAGAPLSVMGRRWRPPGGLGLLTGCHPLEAHRLQAVGQKGAELKLRQFCTLGCISRGLRRKRTRQRFKSVRAHTLSSAFWRGSRYRPFHNDSGRGLGFEDSQYASRRYLPALSRNV